MTKINTLKKKFEAKIYNEIYDWARLNYITVININIKPIPETNYYFVKADIVSKGERTYKINVVKEKLDGSIYSLECCDYWIKPNAFHYLSEHSISFATKEFVDLMIRDKINLTRLINNVAV